MADRFFADSPIQGQTSRLTGPEAHHLLHVMRAKPGDLVTLFDGTGSEYQASVATIGRGHVDLAVGEGAAVDRELGVRLTLGVSLPKGSRQQWLVEKLVELGVARLVPLETDRSIAQPGSGTLAKLRRQVIESSKQCGRNRLMEIAEPESLATYLSAAGEGLLAHPGGKPLAQVLPSLVPAHGEACDVRLAVGPEGGFTDSEVELAITLGWQPVSLGKRILRIETAAAMLAAVVAATNQA